jgi:hypothetical protein
MGTMKRLIAVLSVVTVLGIPAPAQAGRGFANCTQMHHRYAHGVARSRAAARREVADGYGRPAVKPHVYALNRSLDANDDGVACEA